MHPPDLPRGPQDPPEPGLVSVEFASRAIQAVRQVAATEILPRFRTVSALRKDDGSLVTEADLAGQRALAAALARIEPVAVLGEEMDEASSAAIWERRRALLVRRPARRHRELQRRRPLLRGVGGAHAGRPARVRHGGRPDRRRGLLRRARRRRLARRRSPCARPRARSPSRRPWRRSTCAAGSRTCATRSSTTRPSPGGSPAARPRSPGATSRPGARTSSCTPARRSGTTPPAPSSRRRPASRWPRCARTTSGPGRRGSAR